MQNDTQVVQEVTEFDNVQVQDATAPIKAPIVAERQLAIAPIDLQVLISIGLEKGVTIEIVQKLLDMYKELKADAANSAFFKDFSGFQNECPIINKNKKAGKGSFNYEYATLDTIVSHVQPYLTKYGFSYTFKTENNDMVCEIHHKEGHTESARFPITIDSSGSMNAIQKIGSARSYAKRYSLCDALGIATADGDDDGQSTTDEKVTTNTPVKNQPKATTAKPATQPVQQQPATEPEPEDDGTDDLASFITANGITGKKKDDICAAIIKKPTAVERKALTQKIIKKHEAVKAVDRLIESIKLEMREDWIEEKELCDTTEAYDNLALRLRNFIESAPDVKNVTPVTLKTIPLPGAKKPAPTVKNNIYKESASVAMELGL